MAGVIFSHAYLLELTTEISEIPVNVGVFKKDCTDLTRRLFLLKPFGRGDHRLEADRFRRSVFLRERLVV